MDLVSFFRIPFRNINRNRLRSILLILGVGLTVSLQLGIAISVDSMTYDFIQQNRNRNFTDLTVQKTQGEFTVEQMNNLIPAIESVPGIGKGGAASVVSGNAFFQNEEFVRDILIYGCDTSHPDFAKLDLVSGRRSLKQGEIILAESIARRLLKEVGDDLTLQNLPELGFNETTLQITGIMDDDYYFGNYIDNYMILFNIEQLNLLVANKSRIDNHVAVSITDLININDIAVALSDAIPEYTVVREKHIDELKATGLSSYQTAMTLLIVASYLIEFLFITNILVITMKERSREFGIMRAVGTSRSQIVVLILAETFLIGLFGSLTGVVIGIGLAYFLLYIFRYYLGFTTLSALILLPETVIISIFTGIVVTILSGLYPLITALRLPIVQTIHSSMRYLKKRRIPIPITWKTTALFGILTILTGVIFANSLVERQFLGFELGSEHFIAIVVIFIGIIAVEGALLVFIPKIVVRILSWRTIAPILIAAKDIERESQRSAITIFTAALSLSFILMVGNVSAGLLEAVPPYYTSSFGETDITIEAWDHLEFPLNFGETLREDFWWVENVSFLQEQRTTLSIGESVYMFGVNGTSHDFFLNEFILQPENASLSSLLDSGTPKIVVTDILSERLGISIDDDLSLELETGTISLSISGICSGNPFIHGGEYIFIDSILFQQYWSKTTSKWFVTSISEYMNLLDAEKAISDNYPDLKAVKSTYYYFRVIENSLGVQGAFIHLIFIHTFFLSGLTQFISILISTLKMERDVAIMRSFGLSKREVFRIFLSEAGILGFSAVIVGIVNGIIGSELFAWLISQSIPIQATVDTLRDQFLFVLWILVALLVTLGSTYVPSKRATQTNIIAAISGRHDEEEAISIKKEIEIDFLAVKEKMADTPSVLKETELKEKAMIDPDELEIRSLLEEISQLSQNIDVSDTEKQKNKEFYDIQIEKYGRGELTNRRFLVMLKRYKKILLK